MALNTGGFTLGVMPEAPRGVENLGRFDVGQVLAASRAGAENVEQSFNTPFRVQQEIAKTKTAKAQSDIAKVKAANAPALLEAQLAGQRESVKSNILANKLSSNTLAAKTKLTQTQADLSAAELAFTNETSPIKKQALQANLDTLRAKADTDKAEYDAALSADLFAAQAGVKAWMARAGTKALAAFSEDGTREVAPGVIQTLVPTAEGASVSTITTPSAKLLAARPATVPVYMGTDAKGNAILQNYTVDPSTGQPVSAIGAKISVHDLPQGVIGAEGYKPLTPQSAAERSRQVALGKELAEWQSGGSVNAANSIESLRKASNTLSDASWYETGTAGKVASSIANKFGLGANATVSDATIQAREQVKQEIFKTLSQTFPGAINNKEREALVETILPENVGAETLKNIVDDYRKKLITAADQKDAMAKYAADHDGNLLGYTGPTVQQIISDLTKPAAISQPVQTAQAAVKTGPTKAPRVIQNGVTFVLQPDGVTYLPE